MLYAIFAILVLIGDQWLKYWVTANVALDTGSKTLIPGVIKLVNIHNYGATLNILSGARWFFVLLAVVCAVVVIVALARHLIRGAFGRWTAVLAMAGAIGNGIDRGLFGYVVDMFRLEPKFLSWFGIFNLADIFITVCGVLFCFYLIFGGTKKHRKVIRAESDRSGAAEPSGEKHGAPRHTKSHEHVEKSAPRHDAGHAPRPAEPAAPAAPVKPSVPTAPVKPSVPTAPVKPSVSAAPAKPSAPAEDGMDFSLDDILDEFK